jgi:transketolase
MNFQLVANTLRVLSLDAVQKANSGHPGLPMGAADLAAVLFLKHLRYSAADPAWANRDRFVLSAGHGCMLLYSFLHLAGYDLPLEELAKFRQLDSRTPGHPEVGVTPGVETSTGPLGQGCGNAVGMALAEAMLASRFNTPDATLVDHRTYVLASDGDLMEGISHEAFSLAGHLKLHKLIVIYDSNRITIEGSTDLAYSDDVRKRFESYHWNVLEVDGHSHAAVDEALARAREERERPTLILARTTIAKGSPHMAGNAEAHGAPLGPDEVKATKRNLGFPEDAFLHVPEEVRTLFAQRGRELDAERKDWEKGLRQYRQKHPDKAAAWDACHKQALPKDLAEALPSFDPAKPIATRSASHKVLQSLARAIPELVGGSADLAPSTRTLMEGCGDVGPGAFAGRNFHFGIREHAMGAILNGLALHRGFRVFGSTFFVFSDYFRPSIRLAAIMKLPVVYVLTHDSFYVGEDGPTHQPVEHAAALRAIPNLDVLRPADATETAAAWAAALARKDGPTALLLTRQNVPVLDRTVYPPARLVEQGAYVLWQHGPDQPKLILIATGSEVHLALKAAQELARENVAVRVVSMPSWELFECQPAKIRRAVLPPRCKARLAIEAGVPMGWERYVGAKGRVFGLNRFGESGPYQALEKKFGFTAEAVAAAARDLL